MAIVAALTSRPGIERVLRHLGLPIDAPGFHPARPPPQSELSFGDETADCGPDPPPPPEDFAA
jgi:hypothetical protein